MVLLFLNIADLHPLYWLVSFALPLLLLLITLIALILAARSRRQIEKAAITLDQELSGLKNRDINNLPKLIPVFEQLPQTSLRRQLLRMTEDSQILHEGRWLADPSDYLQFRQILPSGGSGSLSARLPATLLSVGLLDSLAALLLTRQYTIPQVFSLPVLVLTPLITALALSLLLFATTREQRLRLQDHIQSVCRQIGLAVPVFGHQAGLSLLIDQFMRYDHSMHNSIQTFTATAERLAESDMAEGIQHSVEKVLLESVAPSIRESTAVLHTLSDELIKRQENGMQDLAARFAEALSAEIAAHLHPVNREISQMTSLMRDVKNYVDYAMRALENVRQESDQLLKDTQSSLQQMADARTALSEDFSAARGYLDRLSTTSERLAELQDSQENGLSATLQTLSDQLSRHSETLHEQIQAATTAMQAAQQSADHQSDTADRQTRQLGDQIDQLNSGLTQTIEQLLQQVSHESGAVAAHAAEIGQELTALNRTLSLSLHDFSQESSRYVQETLHSFDNNLAELIRRLSQATVEIRDAVDALPAALKQKTDYSS